MVASACIWVWSVIEWHLADVADQAFYQQKVLPSQEEERRQFEAANKALSKALDDRKHGIHTPIPKIDLPSPDPTQEWINRRLGRFRRYSAIKFYSFAAFQLVGIVWVFFTYGVRWWQQRKWASPDRLAVSDAGARIAEQMTEGRIFVASGKKTKRSNIILLIVITSACLAGGLASEQHLNSRGWIALGVIFIFLAAFATVMNWIGRKNAQREIRIDLDRAVTEFRNFTFVTSFSGNRVSECTEVPFADILESVRKVGIL